MPGDRPLLVRSNYLKDLAGYPLGQTGISMGSLGFTDKMRNQLVTSGNYFREGPGANAISTKDFKDISFNGVQQNILWLSFVARQTQGTTDRYFDLVLRGKDNTCLPHDPDPAEDEILAIGMPSRATAQQ